MSFAKVKYSAAYQAVSRWIRLSAVAVLLGSAGIAGLHAQSQGEVTDSARMATQRRQQILTDVERLIREGDQRLLEEDFAGAVDSYRRAFLGAPEFAAGSQVRNVAFEKYQVALRRYADTLAREGRRNEAITLVETFFAEARDARVPAELLEPETRYLLQDLKEGEVYSPSLTPEHIQKVSRLKELFGKARGFLGTGQYDLAESHYHQILNIDPTNTAARHGLIEVEEKRTNYAGTAYNQTRDTFLRQVAEQWESPVPRMNMAGLFGGTSPAIPTDSINTVQAKLNSIILPAVEFSQTQLSDVLQFLTARSRELDTTTTDPAARGVNIILAADAQGAAATPISMQLTNVPLRVALDYATQLARMKYRVDQYAVTVVPLTAEGGDEIMLTRSFPVPPDFLSGSLLGDEGGGGGAPDPFADIGAGTDGRGGATLQRKLTAREFLQRQGVTFPEGSSAQLSAATSMLIVRNTESNLDMIDTLVASSFGNVTRVLKMDVTLLDISESDLNELGMDWLLGQSNLPGTDRVFTSGGTYGDRSIPPGAAADLDYPFVPPGTNDPIGRFPLNAGNRTGGNARIRDTIDDQLVGADLQPSGATRSPGVFALSGVFTDPQFQAVLRAVRQSTSDDRMEYLSVVTQSGQRARVESIREFVYPEEYDPPEVPDAIGGQGIFPIQPSFPSAWTTRNVGSMMEVEGIIGPDDLTVNVVMTPEFVEFEGFINYGLPIIQASGDGVFDFTAVIPNEILQPIFNTVRETVDVEVYDGSTIAVGGLLNESRSLIQDKTPMLGDIPLMGSLFRTEIEQRERRAIVFFVTVNIVDPAGESIRQKLENVRP